MTIGLRLKGQEVSVIVVAGGSVVQELKAYTSFNDESKFELKQDGFLGEKSDEYDYLYQGEGFDFEMQLHRAQWENFRAQMKAKAKRENVNLVFNVVRIDFFPNGDTVTKTFPDVSWGPATRSMGGRGDYVKVKFQGACSEDNTSVNAFA